MEGEGHKRIISPGAFKQTRRHIFAVCCALHEVDTHKLKLAFTGIPLCTFIKLLCAHKARAKKFKICTPPPICPKYALWVAPFLAENGQELRLPWALRTEGWGDRVGGGFSNKWGFGSGRKLPPMGVTKGVYGPLCCSSGPAPVVEGQFPGAVFTDLGPQPLRGLVDPLRLVQVLPEAQRPPLIKPQVPPLGGDPKMLPRAAGLNATGSHLKQQVSF